MICKSGNLLGMWEALPVERNTPNWQNVQPIISDMGSRNGMNEKECCLEGNEYIHIYLLEFRFLVLQHWKFLDLVQRDIPQAICTIILTQLWRYSAIQSELCFCLYENSYIGKNDINSKYHFKDNSKRNSELNRQWTNERSTLIIPLIVRKRKFWKTT